MKLLDQYRVIIVGGSGGVGKTSVSAALGCLAAQQGHNTLVLTIDPARRLAGALGLEGIGHEASDLTDQLEQSGFAPKGRLEAMMLDVQNTFDKLVERYAPDNETAEKILANRLYKTIAARLSGSQEYASMQRLYEIVSEGRYDRIILDTPPTTHALDFLTAPQRLTSFFDSRVLSLFINIGTQVGWNIIRPGTSIFLKGLQKLTGSRLIEEMADFFALIDPILKAARQDPERANALLKDESTAFMVVSGPQLSQLDDAKVFETRLRDMAIKVEALVVNRVLPLHLNTDTPLPATEASDDALTQSIIQWGARLETVARNQVKL
ncbi:MAG: ArsA-related P-loop ATPase, partial [Ketobacteraceae bacterium]|nr:ArsA-related P-loop ATPase [Ketobacteraceae bacterium]